MQRPFAARRLRTGALDRRVAIGAFSLSAIVVLAAVAFARAPLPEIDVRDPAAARDLIALMRLGERGRWIVSYDFDRTLANGRTLGARVSEGRSASLHVVINGAAMTIERGDRTYDCTLVGDRSGCQETSVGTTLPESEVLRVAVGIGAYNVVREPDTTIAGIRARCFRVRATGQGGLPSLGVETDRCLSANGIPLRLRVVRPPGTVDEQTASSVRTAATVSQVNALAESFARNS